MDRREFLGLGSAAALAVLYPGATASALAGLARSAEGTLVVADHRYSDSLIFARALGNRGASVFSIARRSRRVNSSDDRDESVVQCRLRPHFMSETSTRASAGRRYAFTAVKVTVSTPNSGSSVTQA